MFSLHASPFRKTEGSRQSRALIKNGNVEKSSPRLHNDSHPLAFGAAKIKEDLRIYQKRRCLDNFCLLISRFSTLNVVTAYIKVGKITIDIDIRLKYHNY